MAKIARQTHKPFGSTGSSGNFAKFGSLVAGAPVKTKDIATIMALAAWDEGFQSSIYGANKNLMLEDLNSFCLVHSEQLAYIFQMGIPEWDASTTYYKGSVVQRKSGSDATGELYMSLIDNNTGNAVPVQDDNANWEWINRPTPTDVVGNALLSKLIVKTNTGSPLSVVDITADVISVQGTVLFSVSKTASKLVSGAGGLDTGTPLVSNWYAIHIICNEAGTLVSSLLSLSATSPILPSGYTRFRRVGWVRNNASGNFCQFTQYDGQVWYEPASYYQVVSPSGVTSFAQFVPPTSYTIRFGVMGQANPAAGIHNGHITWRPNGATGTYTSVASWQAVSGGYSEGGAGGQTHALNTSQAADISLTEIYASVFYIDGYVDEV